MFPIQLETQKNPCALNQHWSYSAVLRENILTDGTLEEFQGRMSSDSNWEQKEVFFFFWQVGRLHLTNLEFGEDIWVNILALAPNTKESWLQLVENFFFFFFNLHLALGEGQIPLALTQWVGLVFNCLFIVVQQQHLKSILFKILEKRKQSVPLRNPYWEAFLSGVSVLGEIMYSHLPLLRNPDETKIDIYCSFRTKSNMLQT